MLRKSDDRATGFGHSTAILFLVTIWIATAAFAAMETGADTEKALTSAIRREVVLGDLKGAMEQYRAILAQQPKSRAVAARALFQIGQCLEKSGRRTEAYNVYTRVVAQYPEQTEAVARARAQLANWENAIPGPLNLKFDQGVTGKLPPAWFVPALPKEADRWAQVRRSGCMDNKPCAVMLVPENAPVHASNLMQSFSATAYRGKMIRFSAWIRLEAADAEDHAQMWLSVDRAKDQKGFLDNMSDRPVRSSEWTRREIETRIDNDAGFIKLGVMSIGRGRVWVDRVSFEVVPNAGVKAPGSRP